MSLEIFNVFEEKIGKKDIESLKKFLKEVLRIKGLLPSRYDISIVFVDDEKIKGLNKKYRNINDSTDVLSFDLGKDPKGRIIGEIYISVPTAEKQSIEEKKSLIDEIAFLSLHGILHILGYDHESSREREEMERESNSLLKYWTSYEDKKF